MGNAIFFFPNGGPGEAGGGLRGTPKPAQGAYCVVRKHSTMGCAVVGFGAGIMTSECPTIP
eukprot:2063485-Amphidinium_carterae.1